MNQELRQKCVTCNKRHVDELSPFMKKTCQVYCYSKCTPSYESLECDVEFHFHLFDNDDDETIDVNPSASRVRAIITDKKTKEKRVAYAKDIEIETTSFKRLLQGIIQKTFSLSNLNYSQVLSIMDSINERSISIEYESGPFASIIIHSFHE